MNDQPQSTTWAAAVAQLAREYTYPPTPDMAAALRQASRPEPVNRRQRRIPAWAVGLAVAAVILLLGILAVPQTRAAVLTFIARIGAISIFVDESLPPVETTVETATAPATPSPAESVAPTAVPLALLAALPGEPVSLVDLDERAGFPVWLPPESSEWGLPDSAVLHQMFGRTLVTLIWDDPDQPGQPILTLSQTDFPQLGYKMVDNGQFIPVRVRDHDGMWVSGPHSLQLPIDGNQTVSAIASNVLIWSDARMTYRIEGNLSLEDALRLAESLAAVSTP